MYGDTTLAAISFCLRRFPWESGRWRVIPWALKTSRRRFQVARETTILTRHGFRLRVDLSDWLGQHVYVTGEYEPSTTRLFKSLLARGDRVIDVGANVGYFTLLAAKCVGNSGSVVAFEPIPELRRRLEENLQLNQLHNCEVRAEAVCNEAGTRDFFQGPPDHVGISSLRNLEGHASVHRVRTVCLDDVIPADTKVALIKIDIEGAECHAIEGMMSRLERHHPDLIVEVTDGYLQAMGRSARHLYACLQALGYRGYMIADNGVIPVEHSDSDLPGQYNALFTVRRQLPVNE
jgi:FkbM family methyltransferase